MQSTDRAPAQQTQELKSWIIEHQELSSTWQMCRAVFRTEVLDFMTDSVLGLQNNARIAMLKKISIYIQKKQTVHQSGKTFIFLTQNALLFTKVPIRPTKTGGSRVSVFDLEICSSFYLLFTWMCTRFVQNIAALFSLSFKLHYLPCLLWKSGMHYRGRLKTKELN